MKRIQLFLLSATAIFIASCQKDWASAAGFQPNVSITIPLLNDVVPISSFGLDTTAYGKLAAIKVDLGTAGGLAIPLSRFNRSMGNRPGVSSQIISNIRGVINQTKGFSLDSLVSFIQNASLANAFQQALNQNSTPPSFSQLKLKPNLIAIGDLGGQGATANNLDVTFKVTNEQNAVLDFKVKLKAGQDSIISQAFSLSQGQSQTILFTLSDVFELPLAINLVNFTYTPQSPLNQSLDAITLSYRIDENFTSFNGTLDTVFWSESILSIPYLDTLSLIAPRSEITFKPNTNFFYNLSTNLGVPLFRKVTNNGNLLFEGPVVTGTTSQFPMDLKTVFGVNDTFSFTNTYYSLNQSLPNNLTTKYISLTEIHTFPKPLESKVTLKQSIATYFEQSLPAISSIPLIDSAQFFHPIFITKIVSENPFEITLHLSGQNYPYGPFDSDSLRQTLKPSGVSQFEDLYIFDSSNSMLSNLVAVPADSTTMKIGFKLNRAEADYSFSNSSKLKLEPSLVIPIDGKISGISFTDTIEVTLDSTLLEIALADTILLRFGSSNPATLSLGLDLALLGSNMDTIRYFSVPLVAASPYTANLSSGLTYVDVISEFPIIKSEIMDMKSLVYQIRLSGDEQGQLRIPAESQIRLESTLVLP